MFMNNMGQDRLNAVAVLSTARHTECSSNVANSKTLYQLNTWLQLRRLVLQREIMYTVLFFG